MTDPKPATPATDEEIAAWHFMRQDGEVQGWFCIGCGHAEWGDKIAHPTSCSIEKMKARIAAGAETIKAKDKEIERLRRRERGDRPKISPEDIARMDAILHPNGRCTCAGEGRCEWCVNTEASIAAMSPDERAFMDHGPEPLFAELATLRAQVETLRAALKKLEWSGPNYSEGGIDLGPGCPACGGHKHGTGYAHHEPGGHRKNCRLRAALAATEPKG